MVNKLRRLWCRLFPICGETIIVGPIWTGKVYCKGCGREVKE